VLDGSGQVSLLIAEGRDLTALRSAEQERRDLERQVHHLQRVESLGLLASGVAHDFNNLLTAIAANAQLAREQLPAGSPAASCIDDVLHASGSAATLTRQLLALGRRQPPPGDTTDVRDALHSLTSLLTRLIGDDVQTVVDCADGTGSAGIAPGSLEQLLVNLALNARDAMPDGGTLRIAARPLDPDEASALPLGLAPGEYVEIRVEDTGTGMAEEVKAHAFEPFFTTKGEGTGLGLATVYGIVRNACGHVELESAPGRGTRVTIHLPRVRTAPAREASSQPPTGAQGRERILIVEDRAEVRTAVERVLSAYGYDVNVAVDGRGALELLARIQPPDLLLSDVRMPGMNGPSLAREVRQHLPHVRVLLMSGYSDVDIPLGDGERVLAKPFTTAHLTAAVREALDRRSAQ
jgi:CheY-like chemotaxis protein